MAFKIPTLSETRDFVIAAFKALFPDRNVGTPRSYHARRLTVLATATTQLHKHVDSVQRDVMPDTAGDDGPIDRWGSINGTGARKAATPARKSGAGRVKGTAATSVPVDSELIHQSSGLKFKIATGTTVAGAGYVDADIVGISTGAQTRLAAGETLEFTATPAGLETAVVLVKALDEDGYDAEQYGAYRKRVLDVFGLPTAGGNQADFVRWILEVAGMSQGFAYPNRAGLGTVDVVGLHTGGASSRIPTAAELAALLAYLRTKAPATIAGTVGGVGALRALTPVANPTNVEILITPDGDPANAFDWTGGPLTVTAYVAGTRSVTCGGGLPSSLKAGHRVIPKGVATIQSGAQFIVESITSSTTFVLQTAPTVDLANTDLIYSGGPLVDPIRNAIVAHMNGEDVYAGKSGTPYPASSLASTVGLEVLAEGLGPANLAGAYGTWNGSLLRSVLGKLAIYKDGVRNYSISLPVADVDPTEYAAPLDYQIGLITPNIVIVRSV